MENGENVFELLLWQRTERDLDRIKAAFEGKSMEASADFMRQAVGEAVVRRIRGRQFSEEGAEVKSRPFGTDWQRAEACREKEKTVQRAPESNPEIPEKALAGFAGYFKRAAYGFAARVQHGIEHDCLDVIFGVDEDRQ